MYGSRAGMRRTDTRNKEQGTTQSHANCHNCSLIDNLLNSKHDLLNIVEKIKQFTDTFINDFRMKHSRERDRVPHDVSANRHELFDKDINYKIVPHALRKVVRQLLYLGRHKDELSDNLPPCAGQ